MKSSSVSLMVTILISFLNFMLFFFGIMKKKNANKKRRMEFESKMNQGRQQSFTQGSFGAYQNRANAGQSVNGKTLNGQNEQQVPKPKYRADNSQELVHKCSVCGRTNITNPELMFRFCSKCAGNHEYCQDHLFTHEHVK